MILFARQILSSAHVGQVSLLCVFTLKSSGESETGCRGNVSQTWITADRPGSGLSDHFLLAPLCFLCSFTWLSAQVHSNMVMHFSGRIADSFDREFRCLYADSQVIDCFSNPEEEGLPYYPPFPPMMASGLAAGFGPPLGLDFLSDRYPHAAVQRAPSAVFQR